MRFVEPKRESGTGSVWSEPDSQGLSSHKAKRVWLWALKVTQDCIRVLKSGGGSNSAGGGVSKNSARSSANTITSDPVKPAPAISSLNESSTFFLSASNSETTQVVANVQPGTLADTQTGHCLECQSASDDKILSADEFIYLSLCEKFGVSQANQVKDGLGWSVRSNYAQTAPLIQERNNVLDTPQGL